MKKMKVVKGILIALAVFVIGFIINNTSSYGATLGIGSENRSTAPIYNLGDQIYCKFPIFKVGSIDFYGESYYKMILYKSTNINIYGRSYDPKFEIVLHIRDVNGDKVEYFYSKDKNNLGYQEINDSISLNAGTYYLGIAAWDDGCSSEYGSLILTENTYTPPINTTPSYNYTPSYNSNATLGNNSSTKTAKYKKGITLSKKKITIKKGKKRKIYVTYKSDDASDLGLHATVSDGDIASVKWTNYYKTIDAYNGTNRYKIVIKGKKRGHTIIKIWNSLNNKKKTIKVRVK